MYKKNVITFIPVLVADLEDWNRSPDAQLIFTGQIGLLLDT